MGKLYIAEYAQADHSTAKEPPLAEQTITYAGASVQCSNAFHGSTRLIRVHTDAICSIAIGGDPTATTNTRRMAANTTEYFGAESGQRIAAIANT